MLILLATIEFKKNKTISKVLHLLIKIKKFVRYEVDT